MSKELNFEYRVPSGKIAHKYLSFRDGEEFPEEALAGSVRTAKTTAGLDFLVRRAIEYPGSNILVVRATLQNLKNSSLLKLQERFGGIFMSGQGGASMNTQEGVYRFPMQSHPLTGLPVQSTIRSMGVDRADIEQILKSTEFSTVFIEEADEVPSDVIDHLQVRSRQQIFHISRKVKHYCMDLATKWGITPERAFELLKTDKRSPIFQFKLGWDDPAPGMTVIKAVWNPATDDHIWQRFIGVPYPEPEPTEEWAKANVGIREVKIKPERLMRRHFRWLTGLIVELPDGSRRWSAGHNEDNNTVKLIETHNPQDPLEIPLEQATLIMQRNCIFAFPHENESGDFQNDANSFLMVNQDMSDRAFMAKSDPRKGRVFPRYRDDYLHNGGNVIKHPGIPKLAANSYVALWGVDGGGNHATAMVGAVVTPQTRTIIFFWEYVRSGVSAQESALDLVNAALPGAGLNIYSYDPAMNKRLFDANVEDMQVSPYLKAVEQYRPGDIIEAGVRGQAGFDLVNAKLTPSETFIGETTPKILVCDTCSHIRETMRTVTWTMIDHQRDKWLVDCADSIKLAVSGERFISSVKSNLNPDDIFRANLAYTP